MNAHHHATSATSVVEVEKPHRARPVAIPPPTIHGTRLPNRDRVRSDSAPNTMLDTSESRAPRRPIVATRPIFSSGATSATRAGISTAILAMYGPIHSAPPTKSPIATRQLNRDSETGPTVTLLLVTSVTRSRKVGSVIAGSTGEESGGVSGGRFDIIVLQSGRRWSG